MKFGWLLIWVLMTTLSQWWAPHLAQGERLRQKRIQGNKIASLREIIFNAAASHGVDPDLVEAIVAVESAFNPTAVSVKGAMGLMQLMPQTASRYGVTDPFDPRENVNGGIRYLRHLLLRFESLLHALAAYNAGERAVSRYQGLPPYPETRSYVRKVLNRYGHPANPLSSTAVLFLGRFARETSRAVDTAKKRYQRIGSTKKRNHARFRGRRLQSFLVSRTTRRRPLREFSTGSLVQTTTSRQRIVELTVDHGR